MSKIRLTVVSFLMLIFLTLGRGVAAQEAVSKVAGQYGCREVPVQCIQAPCPVQIICVDPVVETIKCNWCGLGCVDTSKGDLACAMIAPPSGKSCVNSGGKCTVVPTPDIPCGSNADCGPNSYCYQPPMPSCPPGAMCKLMMPSRVCRTCTPRPACMDANPACMPSMAPGSPPFCPRTPTTPCGFCGSNCMRLDPRMDCAAGGPANGMRCVDVAGKCVVQKPTAQEGQMCGGIAGIMCATGLRCDYSTKVGPMTGASNVMPDRSGICVRDVVKCEWCGTGCRASTPEGGVCPMIAPPGDKSCVSVGGKCTVVPRVTVTPTPTAVFTEMKCVGGHSSAKVNVDINRLDLWMVVESVQSGEKVIYNYSKNGISIEIGPNINGGILTGIRRGSGYAEQLKIIAGETYRVKIFTAPYTVEIPANWQSVGEVNLTFKVCQISGDANGDGKPDLADFSIWKIEYIKKLIEKADFNKDGKVDLADFSIWKNAFLNVTPTSDKKVANEWQLCGGIAGIMCNVGLRCNYGSITGGADRSGVCVSANYPTPFGPPVKEGDSCGGPNGYNCNTSLGLECYRGSGPITTATVGVCRKVATPEGTRMCSSNEQCNTDEYCGYPVGAVIPEGQSPSRACFKKPMPTIQ